MVSRISVAGVSLARGVCYLLPGVVWGVLAFGRPASGEEMVRQWGESAVASSQFGGVKWGAAQATGAPDTATEGDHETAWTTYGAEEGMQWLELGYATAVYATSVRIRETHNSGAVARVELRDLEGRCREVWQGSDPTTKAPGFFEVEFERTAYLVQGVRVYVDTDRVEGWNEIDAVELLGYRTPLEGTPLQTGEEVRQWASAATASSNYPTDSWSPKQATGEPDTFRDGDSITAWTPERKDMGLVWIELSYDEAVQPRVVRIRETFNPGAACKVELKDGQGEYHLGWEGEDTNRESPGYFEAEIAYAPYLTKVARIWLDTDRVSGWNEIDAVELVGYSGVVAGEVEVRQWGGYASASSEYGPVDGSAREATRPPDTLVAGDYVSAWAAKFPDKGREWLEVRYVVPVYATGVRILETLNPGAVVEVELKGTSGRYDSVWKGVEPIKKAPAWFEIGFKRVEYEVNGVRIHLDTTRSKGWEEVDAVQLAGMVAPGTWGKGGPPGLPICQWAARAVASSEFGSAEWGAVQAVGLPDTVEDGDFGSAWAPKLPDGGEEWLQLSYPTPVCATGVRVRETFNPGAVSKVLLLEADGKEHVVWEGRDTNGTSPGYFELVFPRTEYAVAGVKVFMDTAGIPGFNEIDAVRLTGYEAVRP